MISTVIFKNFKALGNYTVNITDFNILVGSNNNGKSTILDAFRALQGAYRYAQRYKPTLITLSDERRVWGYEIPDSSISISIVNIQTDFSEETATVTFKFKTGQALFLEFAPKSTTKLYFNPLGKMPKFPIEFKKAFPLELAVIPTLGPFESEEDILEPDYVKRWHNSRRAPRLFRNYWHRNSELFDEFRQLVEKTWPGMSIQPPTQKPFPSKELVMFYQEERIPREIGWSGFGFQIWLQLLTHIIAAKNADILIVDEPEIYLHPDLQHKILDILKSIKARVVLATHSIEIINNAEPHEVLLVDKKARMTKRLSALNDLQNVASLLGSNQNIQLTRLAKGKKILFVEGQDIKLLHRFGKAIGFDDLFSNGELTVIPIEGFSQHTRITNTAWTFSKVLGQEIKLSALLDRDYRSDAETQDIKDILSKDIDLTHILERKEIENYLLVPTAIEKAILDRLKDRPENTSSGELDIQGLMYEAMEYFKNDVNSQLMANKLKYRGKSNYDSATLIAQCMNEFESNWQNLDYKLCVVPGKILFSKINEILQTRYRISITHFQVINYIKKSEIGCDLIFFMEKLKAFSTEKVN